MGLAAAYWARLERVDDGNTAATAAAYDFNSKTTYDELAQPRDQRQLPMEPMMPAEAIVAFDEWANKADKATY